MALLNVHVELGNERRKTRVNWDYEGCRFYYFADDADLEPLERFDGGTPCVYMVPLDSSGVPESIAPKLLKFMMPSVRRMVSKAVSIVRARKLFERAREERAASIAADDANRQRQEIEKRQRDKFGTHGHALLQALREVAQRTQDPVVAALARQAIAEVCEGEA